MMIPSEALTLCHQARQTYDDFLALQKQDKVAINSIITLDHHHIHQVMCKATESYQQFIQLNTYQFKEDTLEYFYIEKSIFQLDNNISEYHQYVLNNLTILIQELTTIKDGEVSEKTINLMQRTYKTIQKTDTTNMSASAYAYKILKKIVEAYINYIEYFCALIENNKDKKVIDIIQFINHYLINIGIYTIATKPGDKWNLLLYEPEINDSNNETDDQTLEDCIHRVYYYAYVINIIDKEEPLLLKEGKAGIWNVR
ncbi:MAG: hypothetical protein LUH02_12155 [Erysipelotrichaceae bacterium]|nr:hypothetical protein [Erysipelotrichaceae bacterium]